MSDLINNACGTLLVISFGIIVVGALVLYLSNYGSQTYDHGDPDPEIYNAAAHDRKKNEATIIEAAATLNQRRSGHERGGEIELFIDGPPPESFDAKLALKDLVKAGAKITFIDRPKK